MQVMVTAAFLWLASKALLRFYPLELPFILPWVTAFKSFLCNTS